MTAPYTSETLPAACAAFTALQEGRIPWMYRDNAKAGNVTACCGHLFRTAQEVADVLGVPVEVVRPQFDAVAAARPGMRDTYYSTFSRLRFTDSQIDSLTASDLQEHIGNCARIVPGFWQMPGPVQVAAVDLAFNTGSLSHWPKFCAACEAGNWQEAAVQSNRPQLPARSAATKALILSAVQS